LQTSFLATSPPAVFEVYDVFINPSPAGGSCSLSPSPSASSSPLSVRYLLACRNFHDQHQTAAPPRYEFKYLTNGGVDGNAVSPSAALLQFGRS
jgi:hypothetical protein